MDSKPFLEALQAGLGLSGEREAEVYAKHSRSGIARFANNVIGQHVDLEEVEVTARVVRDGRVGMASTSQATPESVAKAIADAAGLCSAIPAIEGFPGLGRPSTSHAVADTGAPSVQVSPAERTECLGPLFRRAAARDLVLSGTLETAANTWAVANTHGIGSVAQGGRAQARVFAFSPDRESGFGGALSRTLAALDVSALADRAITRCEMARHPRHVPPGPYDVLLEPPAVAELLEWLAMTGFGAREVEQGTSFLAGRAAERVTGAAITLVDDPVATATEGFAAPFDREGTAVERVTLVEAGIGRQPVFDRLRAARAGVRSTGHAVVSDGELMPGAMAVRMEPGTVARKDLLGRLDRGLWISRFHYVNGMLDTRRGVMTGMTRDGTFWVEQGEPGFAVGNLRFTDSILEALGRVDGISDQVEQVPTWWAQGGVVSAPALLIRGLRFTGTAEPS